MKKTSIFLIVLLVLLTLTACVLPKPLEKKLLGGNTVQIPNPWRDITEDEAKALCPGSLCAPEGAENVRWSAMETAGQPALVQLDFELNGYSYTAREQVTNDQAADISGMYYTWMYQIDMTLQNWEESAKAGTCFRYIGEGEWVDLCTWYDTAKGVSYSLGVTAKDLDGFDLQAIVEALCVPQAPAADAGTEAGRQDGERYEAVIIMEGMEETVQYEHVRNDTIGFEMDYEYERFERRSEADRERFISIYDWPEAPENYLELTYSAEDADTVAASVRAELSQDYDLLENTRELAGVGSCLYIEASNAKDNGGTPDQLQSVYIIPTGNGCLVAAAHYSFEAAEGFGRRFSYMLNTLTVLDR